MSYSEFLEPDKADEYIWRVLLAIHAQAALLVPVDKGQLRNSLSFNTKRREAGFNESGGEQAPAESKIGKASGDYEGYVGTGLVYAASQEYGDADRNIPSQAYLRPAAKLIFAKVRGIYYPEMKKEIAAMARKQKAKRKSKGIT